MHVCRFIIEKEMGERYKALNRVGFPSATVQTESTADGDAAVFIPHIQPQLTSAPSFHTVDVKMYMYSSVSASFGANQQLKTNTATVSSLTVRPTFNTLNVLTQIP